MEAPLNHKAEKYITRWTANWSEVAQFMMLVAGNGLIDDDSASFPVFDQRRRCSPLTRAQIRKASVEWSSAHAWQMEEGFTQQELDDLQSARSMTEVRSDRAWQRR